MNYVIIYAQKRAQSYAWIFTNMTAQYFYYKHSAQNVHSGNTVCKIGILAKKELYENLCRTEV